MAHRRIRYRTQSCPKCGARVLKVAEGDIVIGSPLLVCKECGCVSYTKLCSEWYNYPKKWMLGGIPLILLAASILLIILSEMAPEVIFGLAIIWVITFGVTAMDVVRMIRSKKRMRDSKYLERLLRHRVISQEEYKSFMRNAK